MVISKKFVSTIMAIVLAIVLCPTLALAAPDAESLAAGPALTSSALQAQSATVTQQQAVQWAEEKADTRWYNKLRDPADTSGETQCVELIHAYYEFLGYGLVYGDAGDYLYDANGACLYSEGWSRPPTADAKPGDIAIWAGSPGHIGIVLSVEGGGMVTAETNYDKYRNAITAPDGTYQIGVCTRVNRQISEPSGLIRPAWLSPENPMTVTASDKSLKASAVKSAAKKVSPFAVADASGAVTFSDAGSSKYLAVAADGKVTVKKGTPAGTYTAKATVKAAGDDRYKEKTVAVQAKIQVVSPPSAPNALTFKTSPLPAGFKASWSKAKRASGYEIAYASAKDSAKGWQTAAVGNVLSAKVTGLKQSALYTVKIRSFAKAVDGKKYYSGWGAVSNVKTKANTYKVTFVANGGKGAMKAQTITRGKSTALSANKFTRSGYKFSGWNTKANGKGKAYKNKAKVKNLAAAGKTVKLYAQWKKNSSKASLIKLSLGKSYSKYDLTGDGKRDKLLLKAITDVDHPDIYYYLYIYLNGKKIESLVLRQTVPEAKLAILSSGQALLYVRGMTSNAYYSWGALFKCKSNKLVRVADTSEIVRHYSGSHSGAWRTYEILDSVKNSDLIFRVGSFTTDPTTYTYRYKSGKLVEI